ncbi:unnamed protein product [Urochloa humidicola]
MAFAVAFKRAPAPMAGLLKKLFLAAPSDDAVRPASAAAARRLFNTGAAKIGRDEDRRRRRAPNSVPIPMFFSADGEDPFVEPAMVGRVLALMEDDAAAGRLLALMEDDAAAAATRSDWWVSSEDDDAVQLKVAMPGLGKEHVKLSLEKNILVIEGDRDPKDRGPARYTRRIGVPSEAFNMEEIKAEMANGVLKITVPKIKIEAIDIKIE